MARPNREQRERIDTALRQHAVGAQDLTPSGYGRAAGIKPEYAAARAERLGLPVRRQNLHTPPPPQDRDPSTSSSPDPAPESIPPIDPKDPAASTRQIAREEAGTVARRTIEAKLAEVRAAATGSSLPDTSATSGIPSPTVAAIDAAAQAASREHVASVASEAERLQIMDETAGELIRRMWHERYRSEFPGGPADMLRTMEEFWWDYRDAIVALQDGIDAYAHRVDELEAGAEPANRRQEAWEGVLQTVFVLEMNGRRVSQPTVHYLLECADAFINGQPIPDPIPPAPFAVAGG